LRCEEECFCTGDSVVAYAVVGGICLVSPDPIGPAADQAEVWARFREFAGRHGWPVAVMGAAEEALPIYRDAGMHELYIGDEAVVDADRFSLEGGRSKGLRQAVNRVAKYGYRIEFHDPSRIDRFLEEKLLAVM